MVSSHVATAPADSRLDAMERVSKDAYPDLEADLRYIIGKKRLFFFLSALFFLVSSK